MDKFVEFEAQNLVDFFNFNVKGETEKFASSGLSFNRDGFYFSNGDIETIANNIDATIALRDISAKLNKLTKIINNNIGDELNIIYDALN